MELRREREKWKERERKNGIWQRKGVKREWEGAKITVEKGKR